MRVKMRRLSKLVKFLLIQRALNMSLKFEFRFVQTVAVTGIAIVLLAVAGIPHSEANMSNSFEFAEPINPKSGALHPTEFNTFSENTFAQIAKTAATDVETIDAENIVQSKLSVKKVEKKLQNFIHFIEQSLSSDSNRKPYVSPKQGAHESLGFDSNKQDEKTVAEDLINAAMLPVLPSIEPPVIQRDIIVAKPKIKVQTSAISSELEPPVEESISLWQEIRDGFQFEDYNSSTVRRYEKWYSSKPRFLSRLFTKAATNLPYVLEQVQRRKLPTEIALLPIIESAYNPYAFSDAGAVGLWQFMPFTGRRYGLSRDYWYEGRRDIINSTNAALDYLETLYNEFDGDWALALAAYNAGENRVQREISRNRKQNKSTKYGALRLPRETRKYLPKLIAIKNIVNDPNKFDVVLPDLTTESTFAIVEFDYQVDLNKVAIVTETDYDEFAQLNPGLRRGMTPPKGPHKILVPVAKYDQILDWISNISPEQALGQSSLYEIQSGDTLSRIALEYGLTIETIKTYNQMTSDLIVAGETIKLPVIGPFGTYASLDQTNKPSRIHTVKRGDTLGKIASQYGVPVKQLRIVNRLSSDLIKIGEQLHLPTPKFQENQTQTAGANQSRLVHRVRYGESLWSISKLYDVDLSELKQWNKIQNDSLILPNQRIVVHLN